MARKVNRNAPGLRQQARSQGRAGQVRKARATTSGFFDRTMNALPFTEEQWHRFFTVTIVAVVLAAAVAIAQVTGLLGVAEQQVAQSAANAGFRVQQIDVRGTQRLNAARVYEKALASEDLSMVLVDLDALRDDLRANIPWVADARVSRQLPDTLVVDIVERQPHAVLRRADRLMLIDPTGVELEPIARDNVGDMMVISGEGAQGQVEALTRLLDAAPALRAQVRAAEWIGNRRWDVTFTTGQVLRLPEGAERSAAALIEFARADGMHRLIGGEVVAFDLRNAPRMYMRRPDREDQQMNISASTGEHT